MNKQQSKSQRRRQRSKRLAGKERPAQNVLPRPERLKLRAGVLKRVEPGDTIPQLAHRMDQSDFYIRQAIGHDLKAVGELLDAGTKVADIVTRRPEWTSAFVDLARRRHFGTQANKRQNPSGSRSGAEPWKAFNRGQSTEARRRRRAAERRRAQVEKVNALDANAVVNDLVRDIDNGLLNDLND